MKKQIYIAFAIFIVLGLASSVLAFWPFTGKAITGDVVNEGTEYPNSDGCIDSDGGVKIYESGYISTGPKSSKLDSCMGGNTFIYDQTTGRRINGKKSIREYYCFEGKATPADYNKDSPINESGELLGKGICILDRDGTAYWRSEINFCKLLKNNTGVATQDGKKLNKCDGNSLITYTCNGNEFVETPINCTTQDSFGKCDNKKKSCVGICIDTDSDSDNNKDVSGKVVTNMKISLDQCNKQNTKIRQFKCVNGFSRVVMSGDSEWISCGTNRECISDPQGAYCMDKYASIEDKTKLDNLYKQVNDPDGLLDRIEKLECQLNPPTESTDVCCIILTDLPICQQEPPLD